MRWEPNRENNRANKLFPHFLLRYRTPAEKCGFVVDIHWSAGAAVRVKIHSLLGGVCRLPVRGAASARIAAGRKRVQPVVIGPDVIEFQTTKGEAYSLICVQ